MLPINFISAVCISIGIASDNLMLSAMSQNCAAKVKLRETLLLLFILLNIQMQAFMYGSKLAKLLPNLIGMEKWIAIAILLATVLRMHKDLKVAKKENNNIQFGLNGFLGIALATSIYVFVLGFSLNALQIHYDMAYPISMIALGIMLTIGWYTKNTKMLSLIKKASLIIMIIGIIIFFIQ